MQMMVRTPSSASVRRTCRTSVVPPTSVPSTKTRPAGTVPVMVARPLTRSMTDPSSAMSVCLGWMPVRMAMSALARRWRHSPWTGRTLRGLMML